MTDGVSDRRMNVPPEAVADGVPQRIELLAYSNDYCPAVAGLMKQMVDFSFAQRTFFCPGHTYAFGAKLREIKFREALVAPLIMADGSEMDCVHIEGDLVHLLTVFPITHREYVRGVEHGTPEVLQALQEAGASPAFDSMRKSVI